MKKFLGVLVVLAVTSPALAGNVQMAIQGPAQVSWNDATGVMTVGKRTFPMINVGNNAKVPDVLHT